MPSFCVSQVGRYQAPAILGKQGSFKRSPGAPELAHFLERAVGAGKRDLGWKNVHPAGNGAPGGCQEELHEQGPGGGGSPGSLYPTLPALTITVSAWASSFSHPPHTDFIREKKEILFDFNILLLG